MIADVWQTVEGSDLLKWLACLGVLLWIWNEGKKAVGKTASISPQPLIVALEKEFVGKPEFQKFEKYVHQSNHDLRESVQGIVNASEHKEQMLAKLDERSKHTSQMVDTIARRTEEIEASKYRDGKDVHERINDVLKAVSRLEGRIDASNHRRDS